MALKAVGSNPITHPTNKNSTIKVLFFVCGYERDSSPRGLPPLKKPFGEWFLGGRGETFRSSRADCRRQYASNPSCSKFTPSSFQVIFEPERASAVKKTIRGIVN